MSASLVVDLRNTANYRASISSAVGVDSTPASGVLVGEIVDLMHDNTFCNIVVMGGASSGVLPIQVQTSDSVTSGSFTDPTSGLAQLPTAFSSGGILYCNSGLKSSGNQPISTSVNNAPTFCSGGIEFAAFQRPHRYARLIARSGHSFDAPVIAGFVSQRRTTGSGGGFSYSPGSGTVNV